MYPLGRIRVTRGYETRCIVRIRWAQVAVKTLPPGIERDSRISRKVRMEASRSEEFVNLAVSLVILVWAQVEAPKGTVWKDVAKTGLMDASSRKVPMVLFAYKQGDGASDRLKSSLENPKVAAVLKSFACVFVSEQLNSKKVIESYVPWICSDDNGSYSPPVLSFGDSKGKVQPEFRLEGKCPDADELVQHLLKVLEKLAPDKVEAANQEVLGLKPLPELVQDLVQSLEALSENMSVETPAAFEQELKKTSTLFRALGPKLGTLKDRKLKGKADKSYAEAGKSLDKLARFKGKDAATYKSHMEKALEAVKELREVITQE